MSTSTDLFDRVKSIFSAYLENNGQRKTTERFAILEEIYGRDDHFEAETLFRTMNDGGFNVSRATVYNTLDLLVQCDLVRKHQFGDKQAQYEKCYGYKQHDHLICLNCGKVVEFCDPRMQETKDLMGDLLDFKISHHSLLLYGYCSNASCREKA